MGYSAIDATYEQIKSFIRSYGSYREQEGVRKVREMINEHMNRLGKFDTSRSVHRDLLAKLTEIEK